MSTCAVTMVAFNQMDVSFHLHEIAIYIQSTMQRPRCTMYHLCCKLLQLRPGGGLKGRRTRGGYKAQQQRQRQHEQSMNEQMLQVASKALDKLPNKV